MKRKIHLSMMLFVLSLLTGCQMNANVDGPRTISGTAGGTVVAVPFTDTECNTLNCPSDRRAAATGFVKATRVPVGETVYWHNKRTGNWGTYCPIRDGHGQCGDYCREFATTSNIEGRVERVYGTACRRPNGTWELI